MASSNTCALFTVIVIAIQCGEHFVNSEIADVRLVGGPASNKGTVELLRQNNGQGNGRNNGTWGTTCGTNFDIKDVIVICKQLGFSGASRAIADTPYGQSSSPTSGIGCMGGEENISLCEFYLDTQCTANASAASCLGEGYLGCFIDDTTKGRLLSGNSLIDDPDMTISYCIQFCKNSTTADYAYAGLEDGDECYCGEAYTRDGELEQDYMCHVECSDDPTESCGGSGHIAVFNIKTPPPTTSGMPRVTDTPRVTDMARTTSSSSTSLITTMTTSLPNPPESGKSTGLYAGIGGGVVAVIIIIVAVILAVCLLKKRTRGQKKDQFQSHDMAVMSPTSPKGGQDNLYHNMFVDSPDKTPPSLQLPDTPVEADNTYYSAVRDQLSPNGNEMNYSSVKERQSPDGGDMYYSSVNGHKAAEDLKLNNVAHSDKTNALIDEEKGRIPENDYTDAVYAKADETREKSQREDFGSLYAKPDKAGHNGTGQASEDIGALYALPDKIRGIPECHEDVKVGDLYAMPDKSRGKGSLGGQGRDQNNGEGLYSLADDENDPHATTTFPGHTSNPDNECGTIMVDNELYAM